MTSDLPRDELSQRMLLIALASMSDECEPGMLTPSCPFYVNTSNGPACGEECQDILAIHGRGIAEEELELGPDLRARKMLRPRARRGPLPSAKPFDASEIALSEVDRPTEQKSTTALIHSIRRRLRVPAWADPDPADRAYVLAASLDELERRSIPSDLLIRQGLATEIAGFMSVALAIGDYIRISGKTPPPGLEAPPPSWVALIGPDAASQQVGPERMRRVMTTLTPALIAWVDTAPIADILSCVAPASYSTIVDSKADRSLGIWLVDRFAETYLHEWRRGSLVNEWRYVNGQLIGCCDSRVMQERPVDVTLLGSTIADLAVNEWRHSGSEPASVVEVDRFAIVAIDHLHQGDREAALAICRALVLLEPNSGSAQNNLGFCLIPDHPREALMHLVKAREDGYSESVNLANELLCHIRLGDYASAVELGAALLAESELDDSVFVWTLGDGAELSFAGPVELRPYVEALMASISAAG